MQHLPALRRLIAAGLVAAGIGVLAGPGVGLIVGGLGLGWSGVELPAAATVRRLLLGRRKDPRSLQGADGPAVAATGYGEAA